MGEYIYEVGEKMGGGGVEYVGRDKRNSLQP